MPATNAPPPFSPSRLVILDRDGVINHDSDAYIKTLDEFVVYPLAVDAIARLTKAGYAVAVATNQSGIARGYFPRTALEQMHARLTELVENAGGRLVAIAYCPHGPDDDCGCRKPRPGLLYQIRDTLGLTTLAGSWMVGDSLRDLQAGEAAGACPALVRTGKGRNTEAKGEHAASTPVFNDLAAFSEWLLTAT
ncbi:D-glycero-beta-D-manno-heptose 1,7-bisphosphate 7-phosphatase [Halomonas piscis]|uniref:D,D-heptose 1,7-bisphosphate phosphatase n=1 Tax=Halomonas piscis TaxID=3031727 RepID=A0ABY9Z0R4_9GAMM|nr:D-glycero-beta-D-manno-heptose 1,7-bisphosphate 7-phosphatase [Halomonas piscis]WNK20185.1 D-glycero-beta-D-manno-heptose 1,7-bisphosphate 7-phosphatase [Halomonas piscis]